MSGATACAACGVALPGAERVCPACGHRLRGRVTAPRIAGVVMLLGLAAIVWMVVLRETRPDPLVAGIQATNGGHRYAAYGRGTDAMVAVTNTNAVPVDVTVLAEGLDMADNVGTSETLRPLKRLNPGETRQVRFHVSTMPIQQFRYTVTEAVRSGTGEGQ